jgi:hypothetical protein
LLPPFPHSPIPPLQRKALYDQLDERFTRELLIIVDALECAYQGDLTTNIDLEAARLSSAMFPIAESINFLLDRLREEIQKLPPEMVVKTRFRI